MFENNWEKSSRKLTAGRGLLHPGLCQTITVWRDRNIIAGWMASWLCGLDAGHTHTVGCGRCCLTELQIDVVRQIVVHVAETEIAMWLRHQAVVTDLAVMTAAAPPLPKLVRKFASLATTTSLHRLPRHLPRLRDDAARISWNVTAEIEPVALWIMICVTEEESGTEIVVAKSSTSVAENGSATAVATVTMSVAENRSVTAVAMVTTSVAAHDAEDETSLCKSYICMYVCMHSVLSVVGCFVCFHFRMMSLLKLSYVVLVEMKPQRSHYGLVYIVFYFTATSSQCTLTSTHLCALSSEHALPVWQWWWRVWRTVGYTIHAVSIAGQCV